MATNQTSFLPPWGSLNQQPQTPVKMNNCAPSAASKTTVNSRVTRLNNNSPCVSCVPVSNGDRGESRYLPPALCRVGDLIGRDSQVRQDLRDSSGVHATVRSYIGLTPSVHIHLTHCVTTKTRKRLRVKHRKDVWLKHWTSLNVIYSLTTSNCAGRSQV